MKKSNIYNTLTVFFMAALSINITAQETKPACALKKPGHGVYVIAHRGVHNGIPENSLPAYSKAIELGCDFVEIDIRTTKDGKFVSLHNAKLEGYVPGIKGKVHDYNLKQLKSLDIGKKYGPQWKGTRIPTFEEILELCKGKIGIYLDLKKAPVTELVPIVKKYGMERNIIWYISAADTKNIDDLKESCPECLLMPDAGGEANIPAVTDNLKPCILASDIEHLSESLVKTAHEHHALVFADDKSATESEWKQMLQWKTDGIQTDRPEALIDYLKVHH